MRLTTVNLNNLYTCTTNWTLRGPEYSESCIETRTIQRIITRRRRIGHHYIIDTFHIPRRPESSSSLRSPLKESRKEITLVAYSVDSVADRQGTSVTATMTLCFVASFCHSSLQLQTASTSAISPKSNLKTRHAAYQVLRCATDLSLRSPLTLRIQVDKRTWFTQATRVCVGLLTMAEVSFYFSVLW